MEHTCDAIHTRRTAHDAFEAALLHRAEDLKDNYCRIMQPTKSTHTRQKKKNICHCYSENKRFRFCSNDVSEEQPIIDSGSIFQSSIARGK